MKLTEQFIKRPKMAILIMLGLLVFGIISYKVISVSFLPSIEFPVINVTATMSGASPEIMASNVASPLEKQFADIEGIKSMSSASSMGLTTVTLVFDLNKDIDFAAMDVQAAISRAHRNLPDLDSPPSYTKVNPTDEPVIWITLTSDILRMSDVYDVANNLLSDNISMIDGVGEVLIYGSSEYAVRVQLDPQKLGVYGIGINEVVDALQGANVNLPVGTIKGKYLSPILKANGQLFCAQEFADVVVKYKNGAPIYIKDLGRTVDSTEDTDIKVTVGGKDAICLAVKKQIGANTIEVINRFYEKYNTIKSSVPGGVKMDIFYDKSVPVKESIDDVKFTLVLAIALVILVIFFFLRNLLGMLITAIVVPLSLIATFIIMLYCGFTLDMLSLLALTLAIGFVVDDAIVILENVVRHLRLGKTPVRAAVEASAEIGFTIISMTLSLVVVFIPILFMSGVIGRILNEFAVTICATVLLSGIITLTLTPMLCSRLLRQESRLAAEGAFYRYMYRVYEWCLQRALRHKLFTGCIGILMLVGSILVLQIIPKGFEPQGDLGFIRAFAVGREGVSADTIARDTMALNDLLLKNKYVKNTVIVTGYPSPNNSFMGILLKPYGDERKMPADKVVAELQGLLNRSPGLWVFVNNPPMIPLGGKRTNSIYQYTIQTMDMEALGKYSQTLLSKVRGLRELQGVNSNLTASSPQINIRIDRSKAASFGLTARDIEAALLSSYAGRRVSWIYNNTDTYKVIVELLPEARDEASDLQDLYVKSSVTGKLVRLDSFCAFEDGLGYLTVNHTNQLPSVTISFNVAPGYSLLEATNAVKNVAAQELPESVTGSFQGMASEFERSLIDLGLLLLLCIFIIYIILGILYEDFLHPLTIISGLPSATFGGLLMLILFGKELDLFGFVGLILLIGIVMKNGIMVVNFAIQREDEGMSAAEAVYQGALIRFRPIMMTTFAASLGALPIALGLGAGSQAREPLGLIIVGGLIVSQFVTLFLTPVVYIYLDKLKRHKSQPSEEV